MNLRILALLVSMALVAVACTSDSVDQASPTTEDVRESSTSEDDEELAFAEEREDVELEETEEQGSEPGSLGEFTAPEADDTPLSIDDAVRVGTLDNGLTYYVRSNDSPGGAVSMRLAVRAGGLNESPLGTGAAHFLEHMMFNGTERFPGNTLDDTLRRIGAQIGPDFNAYTSATETVYQIAVEDRDDNVEVAFDVLSEWASAATIDPDEVAAEAPVVLEELRLRTGAGQGAVFAAFDDILFADTLYEGVNVIGTPETVEALTAEDLRDFYDTWYRPDNMAVMAVGDRSLDELEALIVDRFTGLEARGDIVAGPDFIDRQVFDEAEVGVIVEPSFADSFISVDIPIPRWDSTTVGGSELVLTEVILGIMIDNRLTEAVDSGRLDLRRAGGGWYPHNRGLAYLGFNLDADDFVEGTEVFLTELRSSVQNPFTQEELDRASDVIGSGVEQAAAEIETMQDDEFADAMVEHFLGGQDLRAFDDVFDETFDFLYDLDIDEVNNHYGWLMTSSAPVVITAGPDAERTGTVDELTAAIERAQQSVATSLSNDVEEITDLVADPAPVEEVERRSLRRNEGIELVFENGARVLFAESDISEGQVAIVSESPGGRGLMTAEQGALAQVAVSAVAASGAGEWDPVQLRRYLADLDVSLNPYVADFSEGISASASTDDLAVLFELLHLQLTAPRVDDVPFRQQVESWRDFVDLAEVDSATAANVALQSAWTGGGALSPAPSLDAIDSFTPDDAISIWNDRFDSLDDHVFVVVGDVDEETVAELSRQWIGTLPAATQSEAPEPIPNPGLIEERLSVGVADASGSYRLLILGDSDDTVRNEVLAELASIVLNDRIFTVIREELGATYGGFANVALAEADNEAQLFVSIDGDPGRVDEIANTILSELEAIRSGQMAQADFDEAVSILQSEYNFVNNGLLIASLFDEANESTDRIVTRRAQVEALASIDRAGLVAFFSDIVSDTDRVDIRNIPG